MVTVWALAFFLYRYAAHLRFDWETYSHKIELYRISTSANTHVQLLTILYTVSTIPRIHRSNRHSSHGRRRFSRRAHRSSRIRDLTIYCRNRMKRKHRKRGSLHLTRRICLISFHNGIAIRRHSVDIWVEHAGQPSW